VTENFRDATLFLVWYQCPRWINRGLAIQRPDSLCPL